MKDMAEDRVLVITALEQAGVRGLEEYGRFVNNTKYFAPSSFDEDAAYPVLLRLFPNLTDHQELETVARYLGHSRVEDAAFSFLHNAFIKFAPFDQSLGWVLGDSLAQRGKAADLDQILDLCLDPAYGRARQMVVYSIWRYKSDDRVRLALERLVNDPDVSLQATSALRRAVGNAAALLVLSNVRDNNPDENVRKQAEKSVRKIERALSKQLN